MKKVYSMEINPENWLEHLRDLPSDIQDYKTCTYLVALEGWRRGLKLTFHIRPSIAIGPSAQFSLSNGERTHFFTVSRGDSVSEDAIKICSNKPLTYQYLAKNNIPIPEGKSFGSDVEDEKIIAYAEKLGFPLVLKPTNASSGRGVITDIRTIESFKRSLLDVRHKQGFQNVIVERFITGEDYRIYVINNQVVAATRRTIPSVIGDGEHTIEELIKIKNKIRRKNPFLRFRNIKPNQDMRAVLKEKSLTVNSIPEKGERIFLRRQGVYLSERDPVDITDEMLDSLKKIAVSAMKSIPGLTQCAVDMLVNEKTGEGYVNEINSRPQISNHIFPIEGKARDVPKEIIDFYFPETVNQYRNEKFYFDFEPVYQAFYSRNVREIVIPDWPKEPQVSRRFRLSGNLRGVKYDKWIRAHAAKLRLNGYFKHLKNGKTSIVVSGSPENIDKFRNIITNKAPKNAQVKKIIEKGWDKPIKVGFEFKKSHPKSDFDQLTQTKTEVKKLQKEIKRLKSLNKKYITEINSIKSSKSWKLTKPFRNIINKNK